MGAKDQQLYSSVVIQQMLGSQLCSLCFRHQTTIYWFGRVRVWDQLEVYLVTLSLEFVEVPPAAEKMKLNEKHQ